ncbi:YhgE/Pip domain-containing protein [Bacillus pinisoli]|uniref:YhgE/Pip domain-containing protein n=1 Tax=Bacillus pinisoli TaxID=2901866 RepID=UPI001FF465F6|nr:YhgE/Pip domain-containing protein [Bacillus pinisoli]
MRKKQLLPVALACTILLPSFLTPPALVVAEGKDGTFTSKDEVVYATLTANGDLNEIYVVNTIDVSRAGRILDYGNYRSVKNLTDLSEVTQEGNVVQIDASEGKFYYQGNMDADTELPWDVKVTYLFDGKEIESSELAGKSGHVEMIIETSANEKSDTVFFENYLLQISLLLPNTYQNLEATNGIIANAGEDKQIMFTVMPGEEETLSVEMDALEFEFDGIQIAALPSTLPIDTSEIDGMTDDMASLSDAISELNNGVADLEDGMSLLSNGAADLRKGSVQYHNGISQAAGGSAAIVGGSKEIGDALQAISASLSSDSSQVDVTSLSELPAALTELAAGLTGTADGLITLHDNYVGAYESLAGAIDSIPADTLTEEQITALRSSGADAAVVDQLLAGYNAAQTVKDTYTSVKAAFDEVSPSLLETSEGLKVMSGTLTSIASEVSTSLEDMDVNSISELQKGLATLASNYGAFHAGLMDYTKGINTLSSSYASLHSGIVELTGGTDGIVAGMTELHDGTEELYKETKDLPEQMVEEINQLISEYDKSDFEPVSFVSTQNGKVHSVQFIIKTASVQLEEPETKQAKPEKEKGFWELLMDLFR